MRWSEHETTQRRQAFFDTIAADLVSAAVGPLPEWVGPRKLSGQFAFRGDQDRLAIVSWPDATQVSADEALAWGLAYGGDRDVVLLLPTSFAQPTLQRLPWVSAPVRVFTFGDHDPFEATPAIIPARAQVLAEIRSWGERGKQGEEQLGAVERAWIEELVGWIDGQPELAARHRQSYLAWHVGGRQVLKITRAGSGLTIEAGAQYSKPAPDQPQAPPPVEVHAPLTSEQLAKLRATVTQAVERRDSGDDGGHEEHRLQHAMQAAFDEAHELIGLTQLQRESPAWRPGRSPGYIDFLGATSSGVPHVVETKLDNDVMLALQALDYWIWASANPSILARKLDCDITGAPVIDFVVGASKTHTAVGPYTLRQLEALDGAIAWQFHVVRNWRTALEIDTLPRRRVPALPIAWEPAVPPRYAQRLLAHIVGVQRDLLAGEGPFYRSPQGGLVDDAHAAWADLETRGLLHRFANHVRSSQAFALNLFAGLDEPARIALAALADVDEVVKASEIVFEFEDTSDALGEATAASRHRTQVDVAFTATASDGRRTLLLIEVKLSEIDFGHCSAFEAEANDRRDVCCTNGPFGNDRVACFQVRNQDRGQRRTYDVQLGPTPIPLGTNGCTFRLGVNQPMRNVSLGRVLIAAGQADAVVHALAAPRGNQTIWRRWTEAKVALAGVPDARLADLPADDLLPLLPSQRVAELATRYQLGSRI